MSTPSNFPQQLFLLLISYRDKNKEGKSREKVQQMKKRAQHHVKLADEECQENNARNILPLQAKTDQMHCTENTVCQEVKNNK